MSIKIAYCIPSIYIIGGMEKTLTIKANYFADKLNYKVYIILTDGKNEKPAFSLSDNITIINLDINFNKLWSYSLFRRIYAYSIKQWLFKIRLSKVLHSIKPDITVSMLRREINFITKIKDGSIKVGELHTNKNNFRTINTNGSSISIKEIFAKLWMAQLVRNLKKLDKFVTLSYEDKMNWQDLNNVAVIYNPIASLPEKVSDCTSKRVIAAGRFSNEKGFDMLIDSWSIVSKRHPDWVLTIYGSGDKAPFLKHIVDKKNTESCILKDAVCNLNEKFAESSILAFSSRFEGFGMVITEAMASGIPPVAFACPCGPKDIITEGVNGLLVESGNIEALADKLCSLMENDERRKEMGRLARIRAERFRIDNIAKEWDDLFRSLIDTKNKTNVSHFS